MIVPAGGKSPVLKIVLIVLAVFVGLGIVGVGVVGYIGWRFTRAVHVNSATGEVTVHTSQGDLSASTKEKFTASDLGIDLYPGSTAAEGGMRMSTPEGTMVTGVYSTSDSQDEVMSFYKSKAGSAAEVVETGSGAVLNVKHSDKEAIVVTVTPNSDQNDGKTKIQIVHTVSTKAS